MQFSIHASLFDYECCLVASKGHFHWSVIIVVFNMVLHYGLYLGMALFGSPENEVSIGLHERTGPCDERTKVYTAIGGVSHSRV